MARVFMQKAITWSNVDPVLLPGYNKLNENNEQISSEFYTAELRNCDPFDH